MHEVRVMPIGDDPRADALVAEARHVLGHDIRGLGTLDVHYIEGVDETQDVELLASELFSNPVTQITSTAPRRDWESPHISEVAYRPGVQNPSSASVMKGAQLLGVLPAAVDSGIEYHFAAGTDPQIIKEVMRRLVVNNTVQIIRSQQPETLIVTAETPPIHMVAVRDLSDAALMDLSAGRKLALGLGEMQIVQRHARSIGRDLTDGEIEAIAARRSDHCCHKTFGSDLIVNGELKAPLFPRIKDCSRPYFDKKHVLSAFDDNSGVVRFVDGYAICIKAETHISPFNLEPEGGAATGTGGVLRDIKGTGLGARPILSVDIWGVAKNENYLLSRGLSGVRGYGNPEGVPTSNGSIYVHPDYEQSKSMVLVGSLGIMKEKDVPKGDPLPGDRVIAIGGRTGRDGIHGATFSAETMTQDTHIIHADAVQIGDPIVQQKMFEALEEATEAGLIRAMTDCGAAGFSSAVGEMGESIGVEVDISKAPLKYSGLAAWEIWMSESQERMVAAISPENLAAFETICRKHEVEMTDLGAFGTPDGPPRLHVKHGDDILIDLDYDFLNNGFPKEIYEAEWTPPAIMEVIPGQVDCNDMLERVLGHANVCSKKEVVQRFDHGVQAMHVIDPYGGKTGDGPNNASVLQPIYGNPAGIVAGHGLNPSLAFDPEYGTKWAFAEAIANVVASGADPDSIVCANNYIGPSPTKRVLGGLDIEVDAVMECVHAYEAPMISGKDTNSSSKVGPDGTVHESPAIVAITAVGTMENVDQVMTTDIKQAGSTLILVGAMDYAGMGGSVFYDVAGGSSSRMPRVDLAVSPTVNKKIHQGIKSGNVLACHDVSHGGVATTVAEMCFGGGYGAELALPLGVPAENALLNETAGCYVVELSDPGFAKQLFQDVPYAVLGVTTDKMHLVARQGNETVLNKTIGELKKVWSTPGMDALAA